MHQGIKIATALWLALLLTFSAGCVGPDVHLTTPTEQPASVHALEVTFFDVGQAQSILVTCEGEAMLVDGGSVDDGAAISRELTDRGICSLNVMAATHHHEDHVGGLPEILKSHPADKIFVSSSNSDSPAGSAFFSKAPQAETVSRGTSWTVGDAYVQVLWPISPIDGGNNDSLVLLISYGTVRFLLTGDIERDAENALCDLYDGQDDALTVAVLSVPHHGSASSSSYRLLRETMPKIAVCSVGKDNGYGHPAEEVLSRYAQVPATFLRTDTDGTVVCRVTHESDGDKLVVRAGERSIVVR